jgi:hypothetical protein
MTVRAATIVLGVMLVMASGAVASPGSAVNLDCSTHAKLTRHYTTQQLRDALATMPTDEAEYTDCHDVIQRQLLAQIGGAGPSDGPGAGGGSSGSFLPVWLIIVLVVLAVAAAGSGAVALRRRRLASDE